MGGSILFFLALTSWLSKSRTKGRHQPLSTLLGVEGHFLPSCVLFSQLSQKQIAQDIDTRYIEPLIKQAGLDVHKFEIQELSDLGFSNNVFRLVDQSDHNQTLVAKVFSELAKRRLNPNQAFMGEIDEILYRHGIGPTVLAHTSDALLMEYIDGNELTEQIIFQANEESGISICKAVGQKLGYMHTLEGKGGPDNMLWHALDVLLSSIDDKIEMKSNTGGTWTLNRLQDTIGECRKRLETLHAPVVPMGHGDFKLSNCMITRDTKEVRFIDFELTGTHYRGYDLAKFFRSSKESVPPDIRRRHQLAFWESYQAQVSSSSGEANRENAKTLSDSLLQLEWEAELLEPMTWLEAAAFFSVWPIWTINPKKTSGILLHLIG